MPRVPPEMTRRAREMRNNPTKAERLIWLRVRGYKPRFTRQLRVSGCIIDLACREAKVAIELDGCQHADSIDDEKRTAFLKSLGWTVLRFWNSEAEQNPDGVAQVILAKVAALGGPTHPQPSDGSAMPPAWPKQRGALLTRRSSREGRRKSNPPTSEAKP